MIKAGQYIKDGNTEFIVCDIRDNTPVGTLIYDLYLHDGYIKANGSNLLKSDIPRINRIATIKNLFSETKRGYYKNIDELTIGIPDYRNLFIMSTDQEDLAGDYVEAGLPNIDIDILYRQDSTSSGVHSDIFGNNGYTSGAYSNTSGADEYMQSSKDKGSLAPLAAYIESNIYGKSETVQPPAIKLIAQIKY